MNSHSAEHIAKALGKSRRSGDGWVCCCPAHDDESPSLSISESDDGIILVKCHAGCSQEEVIDELKELGLWPDRGKVCITYDYVDVNGNILYQVVRFKDKKFLQRRPDGNGDWIWKLDDIEKVPYRLPELLAAIKAGEAIFIVEGEKDCDNLAKVGLTATTNSGGAKKWKDELNNYLVDAREVFIFPDNDEVGRDHANKVAISLNKLGLPIKVVTLPGLPDKGDVSDWLNAGCTKEELLQLCADAPVWMAEDAPDEQESTAQPANPRLDDIGNAERFKKMYGSEVLWVQNLRKFFVWDGRHWVIDDTERVSDYAKKVARSIFEEANYV